MPQTATRDAVLLLTHSGDFYTVDLVSQALSRRGVRPVRFNTDLFPSCVKLLARAGDEGACEHRAAHLFMETGEQLSVEEVRAVWARKLWSPRMADDLDERYRAMCVSESAAALEVFSRRAPRRMLGKQPGPPTPRREQAATTAAGRARRPARTAYSRYQRRAAARQFFAETEGETVAKLLRPLNVSMDAAQLFVYTNRVREEDLARAETLRHSPMVFQELIPKAYELRVACVAGNVFAGSLNATGTSRGHTDWRRAAPDECRWQKAQLPNEVVNSLKTLMSDLGLCLAPSI